MPPDLERFYAEESGNSSQIKRQENETMIDEDRNFDWRSGVVVSCYSFRCRVNSC